MNTLTNTTATVLSIALAALLFGAVAFAVAPKAHATELGLTDWFDTGYYDMSDAFYDTGSYGGSEWFDTGYYDMADAYYDHPDMVTDYINEPYYSSSPSYPSFSSPSYPSSPSYFSSPSHFSRQPNYSQPLSYIPMTPSQAQSLSNYNTNTNLNYDYDASYCTGNSCNTTYNDNSVFNAPTVVTTDSHAIVNFSTPTYQAPAPAPAPKPTTPSYYPPQPPVYQPPVYYPQYPQQPRVAYSAQPYISLSQAPYTGLEMGPVATAFYWGFLVLWCLLAAYLIAVKKVHYKIAAYFTGSSVEKVAHAAHAPAHSAPVAAPASAPKHAGIDPFIASQISR